MAPLESLIEYISVIIKECQSQPSASRVFVLFGTPLSGKTYVARTIAKKLNAQYIDLLEDKLKMLSPILGIYSPLDFRRDIDVWLNQTETLLVIDEIEALFDTWTREKQEDFLKLISGLGGRVHNPVLIACGINLPYEDILGRDKVFRIP